MALELEVLQPPPGTESHYAVHPPRPKRTRSATPPPGTESHDAVDPPRPKRTRTVTTPSATESQDAVDPPRRKRTRTVTTPQQLNQTILLTLPVQIELEALPPPSN